MNDDEQPLERDLVALLAHERVGALRKAPAGVKARVLERVESIVLTPSGGGGGGGGGAGARPESGGPALSRLPQALSLAAACAVGV
ncbi:MAG TPA: hypothetical protein VM925_13720, partial [Labilithrix sp.]|nr:hypothetical protein [Labilithrix sp.]